MIAVLLAIVCLVGAEQSCDLKTSNHNDLIPERLVGAWYAFYTMPQHSFNRYSCYNASYTPTSKNKLSVRNIYYDKRNQNISAPVIDYNSEVTVKKNALEWKGERAEWDTDYYVFATDYDNFIVLGGCPAEYSPFPVYWVAFRKENVHSKDQQAAEDALQKYNLSLRHFAKTC